jgi:hypothetical protein
MKEKAKGATRQGQPQILEQEFRGKYTLFFCISAFKHLHNLHLLNGIIQFVEGVNNE